tara:strand:+ start:99 stop:278 length:180 start_codon:yes stop_codon:yes gene_type:complete
MFLEELAITILSMVFVLPFAFLLLNWFLEQCIAVMEMTVGDWIAVGMFFGVAVIITLIA